MASAFLGEIDSGPLLAGRHYGVTWAVPRNVAGNALLDDLEGRDLGIVTDGVESVSVQLRAGWYSHAMVVRLTQRLSVASLRAAVAGATVRISGVGIDPASVTILEVDEAEYSRSHGLLSPLHQVADNVQEVAQRVASQANDANRNIRRASDNITRTVMDLATAAKWAAIGIPVAAVAIGGGYLLYRWAR